MIPACAVPQDKASVTASKMHTRVAYGDKIFLMRVKPTTNAVVFVTKTSVSEVDGSMMRCYGLPAALYAVVQQTQLCQLRGHQLDSQAYVVIGSHACCQTSMRQHDRLEVGK